MKKIAASLVLSLALCIGLNSTSLAKVKSDKINLSRATKINGVVVDKGEYKATFDDQNNELIIWQGKKALVKMKARMEQSAYKPARTTLNLTRVNNDEQVLTAITFADQDQRLVIQEGQ